MEHENFGTKQVDKNQTSNNQRLEKCFRCVFFCFIIGICMFFWLSTYYRHGHNQELMTRTFEIHTKAV